MVAPLDITSTDVEPEKYGEKMEYDSSGPFEKTRARTDYCWFLHFVFFLVAWGMTVIYAFNQGDLRKWLEPTDSAGRVCGREPEVLERPHLVQYNRESCAASECLACQARCPIASFAYNESLTGLEEGLADMLCQPEVRLENVTSWAQLDYLVHRGLCASEYQPANASEDGSCDVDQHQRFRGWRHILPRFNLDLDNAKYSIIGFVMLSALIALLSIFMMRWHAVAFVCGSIFVFYVIVFNYVYEKCVIDAESKTTGALLSLVIFVGVLILIVLLAIYFWRQMYLACQMIRESSKAITSISSSLVIPVSLLLVYLSILTVGVRTFFYLTTMESPVYRTDFAPEETCECPVELGYAQNSTCNPDTFHSKCKTEMSTECVLSGCRMTGKLIKNHGALHFINFFGIYWSYWFVLGFMDTILASVFATWYWTFNKKLLSYLSVVESFWTIVSYHLGSVAFGSLIMFICEVIQFMLDSTKKLLQKINKPTAELVIINFQCIFDSMEKFFNFVNQKAYVTCAIYGSDFIQSGRTSFYLLMRNVERVVAVYKFTNWLIFLLTVLISCITMRISVSYFASREDLTYPALLSLVVFIGSLLATWMILRIVDIAVNTIFLSFLEDSERNDGSYQKPYFMNEELTRFLYKK